MVTAAVFWNLFLKQKYYSKIFIFQSRAGIRHYTSYSTLQCPVFLLNSRFPLFCYTKTFLKKKLWHLFSRSYKINLPSSFNIIILKRLNILYLFTCVGLSTVFHRRVFSSKIKSILKIFLYH